MNQNGTVLVVEDEQVIRETLQLALEMEGYTVVAAANGREALELLSEMPAPSLILLDLMMPVMDGWTFAEELAKRPAHADIPLVLVTAYGELRRPQRVSGVIPKPVDLNFLYQVVRKWSGRPSKAE